MIVVTSDTLLQWARIKEILLESIKDGAVEESEWYCNRKTAVVNLEDLLIERFMKDQEASYGNGYDERINKEIALLLSNGMDVNIVHDKSPIIPIYKITIGSNSIGRYDKVLTEHEFEDTDYVVDTLRYLMRRTKK